MSIPFKARSVCFCLLAIIVLTGNCKKDVSDTLLGPGIIFTTDISADRWYDLKGFLKDNDIKITFYVNGYSLLKEAQISKMLEMQQDGHEIAHHTQTHPHIQEYLKTHSMAEYLQTEIADMKDKMKQDGFDPRTFAYPYGDYTSESDRELLVRFTNIRKTLNPYLFKHIEDMDGIYYRYGDIKILNACSIDQKSEHDLSEIMDALTKAKRSRQTICLYCHFIAGHSGIAEDYAYSIKEADLKAILLKAKELGLTFYTAAEASRKTP
jgi:hypothetical protein